MLFQIAEVLMFFLAVGFVRPQLNEMLCAAVIECGPLARSF